jgi:hypothetical protein
MTRPSKQPATDRRPIRELDAADLARAAGGMIPGLGTAVGGGG